MKEKLHTAIIATILASIEVMNHYTNKLSIEYKADSSPVTNADIASNNVILNALSEINIPILSEEGNHFTFEERNSWESYWIIDPIDGTKGFIDRTNEFAICVGLIENKLAKLGVISCPAKNAFYFGSKEIGAFKFSLDFKNWKDYIKMSSLFDILKYSIKLPLVNESQTNIFLKSKDFMDTNTKEYINNKKKIHPDLEECAVGSALKFGLLAEGFAKEYTRLSPLKYWDIAAGDAIIKSAGKKIISLATKKEIIYNNPEMILNGFYSY